MPQIKLARTWTYASLYHGSIQAIKFSFLLDEVFWAFWEHFSKIVHLVPGKMPFTRSQQSFDCIVAGSEFACGPKAMNSNDTGGVDFGLKARATPASSLTSLLEDTLLPQR